MIISAVITSYFVVGLKIDDGEDLNYEPFYFSLPFPGFRDNKKEYWSEVVEQIYAITGCTSKDDLYITTQDDYLLKSNLIEHTKRISDIISSLESPVVYVGESKGSVNNIISPLIINPSDFYKWFYLADNINQVENYFFNRLSYGVKTPQNDWERGFEESLFREKLSFLLENTPNQFLMDRDDLIITGEGTIYAGGEKRVVLSFLDATPTTGFWRIYLDKSLLIVNINNLLSYKPNIAKKLLKQAKIADLAGCLVVPGATMCEIKGGAGEDLKVNLEQDSISVIPFNKENTVDIKVTFEKSSNFYKVSGGDLGLIVDNRQRPLLKDTTNKQRVSLIDKWVKEISSKVQVGQKQQTKELKEKDLGKGVDKSPTKHKEKSTKPTGNLPAIIKGVGVKILSKDQSKKDSNNLPPVTKTPKTDESALSEKEVINDADFNSELTKLKSQVGDEELKISKETDNDLLPKENTLQSISEDVNTKPTKGTTKDPSKKDATKPKKQNTKQQENNKDGTSNKVRSNEKTI